MSSSPTTLWVLAHPDPRSMNRRLFETGTDHLRSAGTTVLVSDLYADRWNPVLSDADFATADGATLSDRQKSATAAGTLSGDIRREQQKIARADRLVVQFPLWWFGMPAIMKGWFDRVFTGGFAFGVHDADGRVRKYGDGALAGKSFLAVVTVGDRASAFGSRGVSGALDEVLWPLLHGTAHYTGMRALRPHLIASADRIEESRMPVEEDLLRRRLDGLDGEPAIAYRTLRGGDYDDNHVLRPEIRPGATGLGVHIEPI